jgi:hypothetical protein
MDCDGATTSARFAHMTTIYAEKKQLAFVRQIASHFPASLTVKVAPSKNAADELRFAVTDIAYKQEKPGRHVGVGTLVVSRNGKTKTKKLKVITSHSGKKLSNKDRADHLASTAAAWAEGFIETMVATKQPKTAGTPRTIILSSFWCGDAFVREYGKQLEERGFAVNYSKQMEYTDAVRAASWARLEPGRVYVERDKKSAVIYIGNGEITTKDSVRQFSSKTMRVTIAPDATDAQAHQKLVAKHLVWFDTITGTM